MRLHSDQWTGKEAPNIAQGWRRHRSQAIPFFASPEGIRRIIYSSFARPHLSVTARLVLTAQPLSSGQLVALTASEIPSRVEADFWRTALMMLSDIARRLSSGGFARGRD
jgi:hypothetical protein